MTKASVEQEMRAYLQRIATGPELSKDLTEEETCRAVSAILDGVADEVQSAIFLIALRMKRETNAENRGGLRALLDHSIQVTSSINDVVHIADPFDGFTRGLPAAPFLPSVLAACGVATLSSGAESVGPKYGATHRQVLRAIGINVELSPASAARQLEAPRCGWAYVDQRYTCPGLHALVELRTRIVKRPMLTTLEVLLAPVLGQDATHLVTGYVHKSYPPVYSMLARQAGYASAAIVRGVEGGVIASLNQTSRLVRFCNPGDDEAVRLDPFEIGLESASRAVPLPDHLPSVDLNDGIGLRVDAGAVALAAAAAGQNALRGQPGPMYDSLVYGGAVILWHLGHVSTLQEGAAAARKTLDSGEALRRLEAAQQ